VGRPFAAVPVAAPREVKYWPQVTGRGSATVNRRPDVSSLRAAWIAAAARLAVPTSSASLPQAGFAVISPDRSPAAAAATVPWQCGPNTAGAWRIVSETRAPRSEEHV